MGLLLIIIIVLILWKKKFSKNGSQPQDIDLNEQDTSSPQMGDLIILEQIGKGNFGEVYKGKLGVFSVAVITN